MIAIPSAPKPVIARLRLAALEAKVDIKVLPATTAILNERVGIRDLRDINLNDVLGRSQLDTDVEAIAGYLAGKRVLVTGAGGSIGAELCRQITRSPLPSCSCSTATSRRCTPSSCRSTGGRCSTPTT